MNLRHLQYIVAIADEQNISKAAERLFISRPALNHYLIKLEAELGAPLFKRVKKKLIPTYTGAVYVESARRMLEIKKQAYKLIADTSVEADGVIGLGVTREIGVGLLKDVFPAFTKKYPNYRLDLLEGNARELEVALENGRIDLAVMGCRSAPPALEHISFMRCELVAVLPPGHPLGIRAAAKGGPRPTLDLRLLKDDKFILICRDTNIREVCDRHFARAGVLPRIVMECSLSTLAYSMVKQKLGASILMELQVNEEDGVHCFSLKPKESWSQGVTYRKGATFTKVEEYFIQLARDYFAKNTPLHME